MNFFSKGLRNLYLSNDDWIEAAFRSLRSIRVSLKGTGSLSLTYKVKVYKAVNLNGIGNLSAINAIRIKRAASLFGDATLGSNYIIRVHRNSNIVGLGDLTSKHWIIHYRTSNLSGFGSLVADGLSVDFADTIYAREAGNYTLTQLEGRIINFNDNQLKVGGSFRNLVRFRNNRYEI